MTMVYGSFLLSHLPADAIETEAQKLAVLERFASMGYCPMFREVIEGRVVEFHFDAVTFETSYRWLEGVDADAVLSMQQMGGWVPTNYFRFLAGFGTLFLPEGATESDEYYIQLETGDKFEFDCVPAFRALNEIQELNEELTREAQKSPEWAANCCGQDSFAEILEFQRDLLVALEKCMKAGVISTGRSLKPLFELISRSP